MGNFELGETSHLFYKFITVVSTILLYHMYGRRFILFFLSPPGALISGRVRIQNIISYLYVALNTAFENSSQLLLPPQRE